MKMPSKVGVEISPRLERHDKKKMWAEVWGRDGNTVEDKREVLLNFRKSR
jgi:hypothetical protein